MTMNEEIGVFSSLRQFPSLIDDKIDTKEFLTASSDIIQFIDKFGKVFAPVRHDIQENIQKIYKKYNETPKKNKFLEDMLLHEKEEGELVITNSLKWLRRNLHFILRFLQLIIDDADTDFVEPNFSPYLRIAYADTLQPHYGWMGEHLFNIMLRFSPSRNEFFTILTVNQNDDESSIVDEMKWFSEGLELCIMHLIEFYNKLEFESSTARV